MKTHHCSYIIKNQLPPYNSNRQMICRAIPAAAPPRDRSFFFALLKSATNLSQLNQIHAQIILNGLDKDLAALTKLTHKLFDFRAVSQAKLLFTTISNRISPDKFLYNDLSQTGKGNFAEMMMIVNMNNID